MRVSTPDGAKTFHPSAIRTPLRTPRRLVARPPPPRWPHRSGSRGDANPSPARTLRRGRGASRACGGERLIEILDRSTIRFEASSENPWTFSGNPDLPPDFSQRLLEAIVGFEIEMTHVEAKFKLSQNRNPDDYRGAHKGLGAQTDEMSQAIFKLMKPRP